MGLAEAIPADSSLVPQRQRFLDAAGNIASRYAVGPPAASSEAEVVTECAPVERGQRAGNRLADIVADPRDTKDRPPRRLIVTA
jgi:hypothetical protein